MGERRPGILSFRSLDDVEKRESGGNLAEKPLPPNGGVVGKAFNMGQIAGPEWVLVLEGGSVIKKRGPFYFREQRRWPGPF